jgi:glutamate racemase
LATPATVASSAYRASIEALHPGSVVIEQACPAFVPLIEAGEMNSEDLRRAAQAYLEPLLAASVDSIVLGCTHYPLVVPLLRQLLPESVQIIDPAIGVARQLDAVLGPPTRISPTPRPFSLESCRFCVTADPDAFAMRATPWLGQRPAVSLQLLQD